AYRASGNPLPEPWGKLVGSLFDEAADETEGRHEAIAMAASIAARSLSEQARSFPLDAAAIATGPRHLGQALAAVALPAPYLGTAHHHASSRQGLPELEEAFFGIAPAPTALRVLVFSDTFDELNGVAGTMRRLAAEGARRGELTVVTSRDRAADEPGLLAVPPEGSVPLPGYESIQLRVPAL